MRAQASIIASRFRRTMSEETKRAISTALKGKYKGKCTRKSPHTDQEKANFSARSKALAGQGHPKARWWCLSSPDNVTYTFKNLRVFIERNPHLFDPSDLNWHIKGRSMKCKAMAGIERLSPRQKGRIAGIWKGWRWRSITERLETETQRAANLSVPA